MILKMSWQTSNEMFFPTLSVKQTASLQMELFVCFEQKISDKYMVGRNENRIEIWIHITDNLTAKVMQSLV